MASIDTAEHDILTVEDLELVSCAFDLALSTMTWQGRVQEEEVAWKRLRQAVIEAFHSGERSPVAISNRAVSLLTLPIMNEAGAVELASAG